MEYIMAEAHTSGAPYMYSVAKKFGPLSIREILVVMLPYIRPTVCPSTHPSALQGNQCKISHFLASVRPH